MMGSQSAPESMSLGSSIEQGPVPYFPRRPKFGTTMSQIQIRMCERREATSLPSMVTTCRGHYNNTCNDDRRRSMRREISFTANDGEPNEGTKERRYRAKEPKSETGQEKFLSTPTAGWLPALLTSCSTGTPVACHPKFRLLSILLQQASTANI
ncbi:hypothetical protein MPTK1_1g01790 [Marchantia polymorpha subsp. ruderalis]|uniref:Uncharacterized protein n=2 Tax=Marchantia polymorpha TaxID=3197 RepID=A0AAF6AKH5_MARPO|nr:hypothetical protein MARPO_0029s0067 [Marchantia polymorpha]BBM96945.1 hypothetical protein Mp_1g01790 [Marchantia polymorpha subsp. ruderalis]|eukprot:PTQ42537.1 hypothetical protein MARPO_0029s0067 [Marchantia polymorpha]